MEFINYTPFPALSYVMMDVEDNEHHVMVMRATMHIGAKGALSFADEQLPLAVTDEYYGEANTSSTRQESDLAPFKPKCDVIVNANAYSPTGQPAKRFAAGIRIYDKLARRELPPRPYGLNPTMAPTPEKLSAWKKEVAAIEADPFAPVGLIRSKLLIVNGPRYWKRGLLGGWGLTEAEPVKAWPIKYEYAFGGDNRIEATDPGAKKVPAGDRLKPEQRQQHPDGPDKAPIAHSVCPTNTVGCGYAERWYLKAKNYGKIKAPLIESPKDLISVFAKPYAPQGLGAIARTWRQRLELAGTFDEEWLQDRHPLLPEDFDFAYWNAAHPELQIDYPRGDEVIDLINLVRHDTPGVGKDRLGNTVLRLVLPGRRIRLTVESRDGRFAATGMNIDTLILEPDQKRVSVIWRKTFPFSADIAVAEAQIRSVGKDRSQTAA